MSLSDPVTVQSVESYLDDVPDKPARVLFEVSDVDDADDAQMPIVDTDDEEAAIPYWNAARDDNITSEQIRNHVSASSVNEKLLDIAAIPAADPKKFEVEIDNEEDTQDDDAEIPADDGELTIAPGETQAEFEKRARAFKMYIPF